MNTMLSVVVMVFLVATTLGSVTVQEFSEAALSAFQLIDTKSGISAQLINADQNVQLHQIHSQMNSAAFFKLGQNNALNNNVKLRTKLNGDEEVLFDLEYFGIFLGEEQKRKDPISIVLLWVPQQTNRILLHIPVFTAPPNIAASKKEEPLAWRKWAADKKVGIFSPKDEKALETAIKSGTIAFDFMWLEELLSWQIYPKEMTNVQGRRKNPAFATRPIVVSEQMKNVLVKIVNK